MQFSRGLAIVGGVFLPAVEIVRRWHQLGDIRMAPFWLDDWFIGLFLLFGAWRTRPGAVNGKAALASAWGFACGMGYASFFSQLSSLGQPDPSGLASANVVAFKGAMLALAVAALVMTLKAKESSKFAPKR